MIVTRRNFVAGCAAGALLPTAACRAAAVGTHVAPETFGAIGDGVTDDYDAFQRMAAMVSTTGGGTVTLTPGRTYFLNRFIRANNGIADVIFRLVARAHDRGQRRRHFHQGRFRKGPADDARACRVAL